MSIITPDKRELKVEVYLSAIGMTEIGVETGKYSVFSANNDPQNLRPSNYYSNLNNPIDNILSGFGITEFKYSSKIKQLPSVQNAKMSEPYTAPSVSSCTFAYGGIWPSDPIRTTTGSVTYSSHPVFNLLFGPNTLEYKYFNIDPPVQVNELTGLTTPDTSQLLTNIKNLDPFVPFLYNDSLISFFNTRNINNRLPYNYVFLDEFIRLKTNSKRTSYNIWQVYDINSGIAVTNRVIKYEGPVNQKTTVEDAGNFLTTSIRTIRDGLNGSSLYIDSIGKGRSARIKRIFPTSKDALYKDSKQELLNKFSTEPNIKSYITNTDPAYIFYPTQFRRQTRFVTGNPASVGYTSFGTHLCADEINTTGSDNCGFYIKFKNLYLPDSSSSIILRYEDQEPDLIKYPNSISKLEIILNPNSLPKFKLYKTNKSEIFKEFNTLNSPIFGNSQEFDIFVHFAGPVLLIGFDADQSKWNAIYPDKLKDNGIEQDFLFKKEKSFVSLDVKNVSFSMTYSAIMFDNYSFNPDGVDVNAKNNIWFQNNEKTFSLRSFAKIKTGEPKYISGVEQTSYEVLNPKNYVLLDFKTSQEQKTSISQNSLLSSLINQKFMSSIFPNEYNTLAQKPVSIFGDWRNTKLDTNNSIDSIFNFIKIFTSENTDLYKGLNIVQDWGKLIFNGTIEGALFLGLTAEPEKKFKDVDFLRPILKGDISNYVSSISIQCEAQNPNASLIKKTATITLSNLDSSLNGWRILELLEHNIIVVTVKAYYVTEGDAPVFFQGAINNVSTNRNGSKSEIELTCEDLSTYLLENTFFDNLIPYATLTLKDCVLATMQASGFGNYFNFATYENNDKVDDYVQNIDLRLSPNSTTPQDILIGTIYDRILDKLNVFLSKFVGIPTASSKKGQATFRWEPGKGFIFDARYSPYAIDDLLFSGIDPLTDRITSTPLSLENSEDPGWHGLLMGDFTITTQLAPLSSSVDTFGFTNLDGYISKTSDNTFINNALSSESLNKIVNCLTNFDTVPSGYVGFRKKIMDQLDRNEIFSERVLEFKHEQNEKIAKIPYHTLSFSCYVTRPLNFHGTFIIRQFLDNVNATESDLKATDQYIYRNITYNINKSQNLITANVQGIRQPWTIRELEIRNNIGNNT